MARCRITLIMAITESSGERGGASRKEAGPSAEVEEGELQDFDGFPLPPGATGPLSPKYIEEAARRAGQMLRRRMLGDETQSEVEAMREFGLHVRSARRKRCISYDDLAGRLGLERRDFLIFLENGLVCRAEIDDVFLESLARYIGEDSAYLRQVIFR